ncbi:hypothetical protein MCUN1_002463 [Malassezia cuniculi]|uniref:rRNA-processing protein FYV7 n=1 Tax=Malassezia cuniculi TaxID=948313 RepID=A0AAF0ES07_9BASI|nr:hypothetical protein MCUN1_002463 [Malassezia cuniculi]
MAGPDAHKRSVVKHRTKGPRTKGGFAVGGANAAAGTYIGRAKKLKAELIHKAKVKKAYYRMLEKEGLAKERQNDAAPGAPVAHEELGAPPQDDSADDDDRPASAPPAKEGGKPKKLPYFYVPPKKARGDEPPRRTRDEALEERQRKKELWNRKSPSRLGRQRGQPDLGARMEVMLEKIQKGHN